MYINAPRGIAERRLSAIGRLLFIGAVVLSLAADAKAAGSSDVELRARGNLLGSPSWRESLHGMDEWLSAQTIYTSEEVARLKAERQQKLAAMTTEELEDYHRDLDAKLSIVSSPEWQETMEWLSSTLSAAAPSYARKLDLHYPDVAHLTAAQLQRALTKLERRRWSEHQESLAFERLRETRLAMHQRQLRASEEYRERAFDRAAMSNRFSQYHPAHQAMQQRTRRPFYPPYAPFGFGFGFGGFGMF